MLMLDTCRAYADSGVHVLQAYKLVLHVQQIVYYIYVVVS